MGLNMFAHLAKLLLNNEFKLRGEIKLRTEKRTISDKLGYARKIRSSTTYTCALITINKRK